MRRALGEKNKLSMVDHSMPMIDDDPNRLTWELWNNLVHSWIINYVFDFIAQRILYHDK